MQNISDWILKKDFIKIKRKETKTEEKPIE